MYEKITLCLLILFVIARSEEVSTTKNVETANFFNSRLSTILPYPSLYNDEHLIKHNPKRSLILLMPVSQTQNKHKKSKETVQKTKRCDSQHRENRFLILSTKENSNKARATDKNINAEISKQNSDDYTTKNSKYSQKNSATTKRMVAETYEDDKMLLRAIKDNLNVEDVITNLKSQEKAKKCNTEKCICHCEEENCFSSSSKKSSSRILGTSRIEEPEKINRRKLTKYENMKSDILQQKLPKLYHKNLCELPLSNLIDYFSVQPRPEKINSIPVVPVLYEIMSNVSPHMVGNERKYVDTGIPFTSFEDRLNYLPRFNYLNTQNQPIIHKKPCICSPIINRVESSMSITSPSTNYVDATTIRVTTNDFKPNNPIGITEEDQEHFSKLTTEISNIDALADLETKTNLHLNYSTDVTEESNTISSSNLNKVHKSKNFTEQAERNPDNVSELTYSANYVGTNSAPVINYDGTNDRKFINMEECIQLFGRDVCVLSASPKMLAKQAQENNLNKYSTIKIPEYVTQMSTRKETTVNNINYLNKIKATDQYFASEPSTNGINKSNVNFNEYFKSTSTKPNETSLRELHQYPESTKQISEPDINYDKNESFNILKNIHIPNKKLMEPTTDEIAETEKNKLLGKSKKSQEITKLLLNSNEEIANPTSSEKFLYSTPSYVSSSNEEGNNIENNQQSQVTNINSNSNISPKEEARNISYNSKTDSEEQNRNYLKKSNTNIYSEKKIPQEHFKEETTTSSNFKTGDNSTEETKKEIGIETSIQPEEISQEQSTTMQYFDNKKSSNLNNKEGTTNILNKIVDSSTSRLPFCDNTLLLNSLRKVINDFALDTRLTKDFDENILQTQGKNLLPEILQVPNLKSILSMPQIENMVVEKVKDVLSNVTAIPRRDFTNDWSHGVIKSTLHSILDALSSRSHHKLPPMTLELTLEEHQFKSKQWRTNLVTLAPISSKKLPIATPGNLRESIKDLLSSPAIASQTDQDIVRNIIVQSVKNSLTNNEDDKIDDSIIHALNDVLQTLKDSEDIVLEKSNKVINDEEDMDVTYMQEVPASNYETEIKVDNSTLNSKQNLDEEKNTKMDNTRIQTTNYQKAKTLANNTNILTTSEFPQLYEEKEEETTNKNEIEENIRDQNLNKIKKIDIKDDTERKVTESIKFKTYDKAILQNNPDILLILEPNSTAAEQYIKNHHIDKENIKETTTITNFMQETLPNYVQVSDDKIVENTVGAKDIKEKIEHTLNENTLTTTTDTIDPLIILERIKFNLPPTKYYSPEICKYLKNCIDGKNVKITTAPTNFIQETSSNYAENDVSLQNIAEPKDGNKIEHPLTITSDNLISSTNVGYRGYNPTITSLSDKNILKSQQQNSTEDSIIKIHEVTTEVQRTYAKTTYFKEGPSNDDNPRINSPLSTYKTTDIRINNDNENHNSNDNNNLIGDKMNNTDNTMKAKEVVISSSVSSAINDIYPSQLSPSSIASNDISELQRSQLYYINDDVKLPLEIKRLEDGSYGLLISKNICEQILTRKCPCCVPLQGYVVWSLRNHQQEDMHAMTSTIMEKSDENIYANNIKRPQSIQPFNKMITSMIMRRNALGTQNSKEKEDAEEKEKMNAYHLWKQNDDNLAMISIPVIDFAKKYNLLLDFKQEEEILLNRAGLQNKIQNYNKSVMKSVEGFERQSEERNPNNYYDVKKNRLLNENNDATDKFQDMINVREKKDTPNINFPIFSITQKFLQPNSKKFKVQEANVETNRKCRNKSEIDQELKLREVKTANNIQNMNIVQKMGSRNQENSVLKEINNSEESKIRKGEMKWDKLSDIAEGNTKIFHKKENREHEATELIGNDYNFPEVQNFKRNIEKPYRYQRNTNDVTNKGTELVKSMLYWFKSLFVDK